MFRRGVFTFLGVLLIAGPGWAADPAVKCESGKLKETGKYAYCRLKAESRAVKTGEAPDYSRCVSKFSTKWQQAESKGGGACPTEGDGSNISDQVTADADWLALKLAGARFVDNGDGTITDTQTGLMWEKKVEGSDCLHCVEDRYPWSPGLEFLGPPDESPSVFDWLSELNGYTNDPDTQTGFAGYTDWRIPIVVELQTILLEPLVCGTDPCIDPIFGPTASFPYWSSSTAADQPTSAWSVRFDTGFVGISQKLTDLWVRAVRGAP